MAEFIGEFETLDQAVPNLRIRDIPPIPREPFFQAGDHIAKRADFHSHGVTLHIRATSGCGRSYHDENMRRNIVASVTVLRLLGGCVVTAFLAMGTRNLIGPIEAV